MTFISPFTSNHSSRTACSVIARYQPWLFRKNMCVICVLCFNDLATSILLILILTLVGWLNPHGHRLLSIGSLSAIVPQVRAILPKHLAFLDRSWNRERTWEFCWLNGQVPYMPQKALTHLSSLPSCAACRKPLTCYPRRTCCTGNMHATPGHWQASNPANTLL